jgi:hypothetical protein
VAFTAPAFAGLPAVITSYTVTSSPGGITASGASSPVAITGLTEGTPYTFTVTATNASGTGTASAASNSVTPVQIDYIEDVFSTWLYTGNSSTQTITNGIDLAGKGGLVWIKDRSQAVLHTVVDTARGSTKIISTDTTSAQNTYTTAVTSFNANGFSLGNDSDWGGSNTSGGTYASWTFREQPKFFDVVTWTGDGAAQKTIAHNLGSAPGFIIAKSTSAIAFWTCYHRSLGEGKYIRLNTTGAQVTSANAWININASTFDAYDFINQSGQTYVAYLFAHNAGGFGLSGSDNVVSCGSYTGNGSATGPTVTLGYEPQYVMVKRTDSTSNWTIFDNMRGMSQTSANLLYANLPDDEGIGTQGWVVPTSTGFEIDIASSAVNASGGTYIYIAIRRGPMKVPTTGTSVFEPVTTTSSANPLTVTTGFPVDLSIQRWTADGQPSNVLDRLRGGSRTSYARLLTTSTDAELTGTGAGIGFDSNTTEVDNGWISGTANKKIYWTFRRAPGFFDEVCYTGTGTTTTQTHNLQAVPELIIVKRRSGIAFWQVYSATYGRNFYAFLNSTQGFASDPGNAWGTTDPTTTTFSLSPTTETNASGSTYVAYLFATCAGVSKVGSYTGTGTTQTINCGFTGGARFVLIKAASTTGNWLVYDTARGMIPSNDPYLALNSTAAEVTGTDWVDTAATGFELSSNAGNLANSSGVSYIFLAIA